MKQLDSYIQRKRRERERERERECVCVCVKQIDSYIERKRERETLEVRVIDRKRKTENNKLIGVCVFVCVCV